MQPRGQITTGRTKLRIVARRVGAVAIIVVRHSSPAAPDDRICLIQSKRVLRQPLLGLGRIRRADEVRGV